MSAREYMMVNHHLNVRLVEGLIGNSSLVELSEIEQDFASHIWKNENMLCLQKLQE